MYLCTNYYYRTLALFVYLFVYLRMICFIFVIESAYQVFILLFKLIDLISLSSLFAFNKKASVFCLMYRQSEEVKALRARLRAKRETFEYDMMMRSQKSYSDTFN